MCIFNSLSRVLPIVAFSYYYYRSDQKVSRVHAVVEPAALPPPSIFWLSSTIRSSGLVVVRQYTSFVIAVDTGRAPSSFLLCRSIEETSRAAGVSLISKQQQRGTATSNRDDGGGRFDLSYHLTDGETVLEIVERHLVVVHVDLTEEFAQDVEINVEFAQQIQIDVHLLQ